MANVHPVTARHSPSPAALAQWLREAGLVILHIDQHRDDALRIHLECHDPLLDGVWIETSRQVRLKEVSVVRVFHGEPYGVGMVALSWSSLLDDARAATHARDWPRAIAS